MVRRLAGSLPIEGGLFAAQISVTISSKTGIMIRESGAMLGRGKKGARLNKVGCTMERHAVADESRAEGGERE